MVDVHCHLTGEEYAPVGGVDEAVKGAVQSGVTRIVCSGYDMATSYEAKALAERHEEVYFSAGFHPSELHKFEEGDLERLEALCRHEKCVAVGEIGLDYHFDDNPSKERQEELFVAQMRLAQKVGLPIVVHSRDAKEDTLRLLQNHRDLYERGGLLHCYSYEAEEVEAFAALDMYFSFGGVCTFKNASAAQKSVQLVPAIRILTETDCPYLAPAPFRGSFPNQPKHVSLVTEKMAALRQENVKEFEKQVEENARRLFFKMK